MSTDQLLQIERIVGRMRKHAFQRYYHSGPIPDLYDKGQRWGILATLDNVLSEFRGVMDGATGAGHEQTAKQRARLGTRKDATQ